MSERASRVWQVFLMLPFFIIGVAVPVYYCGFSGDGPPNLQPTPYSPLTPLAPPSISYPTYADGPRFSRPLPDPASQSDSVRAFRDFYDGFVDRFVSVSLSPVAIKLFVLVVFFAVAAAILRMIVVWTSWKLGRFPGLLAYVAAAPFVVGLLAVGSSWGLYDTLLQHWGSSWAAPTWALAAAIASLFSLAGVKLR